MAKEMVLGAKRWGGDDFGSLRHKMWEKESKETGRTPACFKNIGVDTVATMAEQQFEMELLPAQRGMKAVVLHSTMDVYLPELECVTDYKTFTNKEDLKKYQQPAKKAQLLTYGLQLIQTGHKVKNIMFLGERWDGVRDNLLGYDHIMIPVTMMDLVNQRAVLMDNANRLRTAIMVLEDELATAESLQ